MIGGSTKPKRSFHGTIPPIRLQSFSLTTALCCLFEMYRMIQVFSKRNQHPLEERQQQQLAFVNIHKRFLWAVITTHVFTNRPDSRTGNILFHGSPSSRITHHGQIGSNRRQIGTDAFLRKESRNAPRKFGWSRSCSARCQD